MASIESLINNLCVAVSPPSVMVFFWWLSLTDLCSGMKKLVYMVSCFIAIATGFQL
jgi:hypothetical protein